MWNVLHNIMQPIFSGPGETFSFAPLFVRPGRGGGWMKTEILICTPPPGRRKLISITSPLVTVNWIAVLAMVTDCKTYRGCFHFYSWWSNFYSQCWNFYSQWWSLHRYTQDSACKFCKSYATDCKSENSTCKFYCRWPSPEWQSS